MEQELSYLQPKLFKIEHNNFTYEVIACHEYYQDFTEPDDGTPDIDFTGNYLITLLTPKGTVQMVLDRNGEDPFEETSEMDVDLYRKIIAQLPQL